MLIVDSQVHIWGADTPERPWPQPGPGRAQPHGDVPLGADELVARMDAAGVAAAVLVPPSWEGERNDLAIQAVLRHPGRFGIMGRIDMEDPANRERIAAWRDQPGMLGIRLLIRKGVPWLQQGASHWLWVEAEKAGVPVTMAISRTHGLISDIAMRHPGLRLSIDHMGCVPGAQDAAAFIHLEQLLQLARLPNVAVKASSAPSYSSVPYPFGSVHDYLHRIFDAFGAHRFFWGTDLSRLPCDYRQAVTMFTEELPWLKGNDLELVMGGGLREWWDWRA
jgi:predicted TIM-barrel fold metal-dependent hydrolase